MMSFNRPSLGELIERSQAEMDARLPGAESRARHSNLGVLAAVHAGALHGLYGYLNWQAQQLFPDSAEAEQLERWASIYGLSRKPAAQASGVAEFSGTDGVRIPAGARLRRTNGVEYEARAEVVLMDGVATVAVKANTGGADGNAAEGAKMRLLSSISGLRSEAIVSEGGIIGGTEAESDANLRTRLLRRIRISAPSGKAGDYVAWAEQVPGVAKAWEYPGRAGLGTIGLCFVLEGSQRSPSTEQVATVQAYIDVRRPRPSAVSVFAPIPHPVAFRIALTPDTAPVRAAVLAELEDLLLREGEPGKPLLRSHITEAISIAAGEHDHTLIAPAANIALEPGELPLLGEITWEESA